MSQTTANETRLGGRTRQLDDYLQRQLSRTMAQVRLVDLFSAVMTLLAGVLGSLFLLALIDAWVLDLKPWMRWTALVALVAGSATYAVVAILPLLIRKINPVYAAKVVESARPELKNGLINYLLLRNREKTTSRRVVELVGVQAANRISGMETSTAVDKTHTIRIAIVLTTLVALLGAYKIRSPKDPFQTFARILAPMADVTRPARVRIDDVTPGDTVAWFGQTVTVSATIVGEFPTDSAALVLSTNDGQLVDQRIPLTPVERGVNRYQASIRTGDEGIGHSLVYYLVAGDGRSPDFNLELRSTPMLSVESVTYHPPEYTGLASHTVSGASEIKALEGTLVELVAISNSEIQSAQMELLQLQANRTFSVVNTVSLTKTGERRAQGEFRLQLDGRRESQRYSHFRLILTTTDGERSGKADPWPIEVIPDLAPEIQIVEPLNQELSVPVNSRIRFKLKARDTDFELEQVRVAGESSGVRAFEQQVEFPPGADTAGQVDLTFQFWPKKLRLRAGETVIVAFAAFDNRRVAASNVPDPNRTLTSNVVIQITEAVENPPQSDDQNNAGEKSDERASDGNSESQEGESSSGEGGNADDNTSAGNQTNDNATESGGDGDTTEEQQADSTSDGTNESSEEDASSDDNNTDPQEGTSQSGSSESESSEGDGNSAGQSADSGSSESSSAAGGESGAGSEGGDSQSSGETSSSESGASGSSQSGTQSSDGANGTGANPGGEANPTGDASDGAPSGNPNSAAGGENGGEPLDRDAHPGDIFEEIKKFREEKQNADSQGSESQSSSNGSDSGANDSGSTSDSGSAGDSGDTSQSGANSESGANDESSANGSDSTSGNDAAEAAGADSGSNAGDPATGNDANSTGSPQSGGDSQSESASGDQPSASDSGSSMTEGGQQSDASSTDGAGQEGGNTQSSQPNQAEQGSGGEGAGQEENPQSTESQQGGGSGDNEQESSSSSGGGGQQEDQPQPGGGESGSESGGSESGGSESGGSESGGSESGGSESGGAESGGSDSGSSPSGEGGSEDGGSQDGAGGSGGNQPGTGSDVGGNESHQSGEGSDPGDGGQGVTSENPAGGDDSGSGGGGNRGGDDAAQSESSNPSNETSSESGGSGSSASESESATPGGQSGDANSPSGGASGSQASNNGSAASGDSGQPGGGSRSGSGSGAGSGDGFESEEDAANLEYTKKATDLVLDYLTDQQANPDPELLERLNWTEDDLKDFVQRWSELKKAGESGDEAQRQQFEQALRSLGIRDPALKTETRRLRQDNQTGYAEEGQVSNAPPGFRAFQKRRNRIDRDDD